MSQKRAGKGDNLTFFDLDFWDSSEGATLLEFVSAEFEKQSFDSHQTALKLSQKKPPNSIQPERIRVACRIIEARRKAESIRSNSDVSWASKGFFTKQSLEQGTHPDIATHHAKRFAGCKHVLEVGAASGFDTAALARVAERVTALEPDKTLARMCRHNLKIQNITNVEIVCRSLDRFLAEESSSLFDGLFADPSRRDESGQRIGDPERYGPPLGLLMNIAIAGVRGIKISPGLNLKEVVAPWAREWIGYRDECREQVLWYQSGLLDGSVSLVDKDVSWSPGLNLGDVGAEPGLGEPGVGELGLREAGLGELGLEESRLRDPGRLSFKEISLCGAETMTAETMIVEPHAALIRSGHLAGFYSRHGMKLIDSKIAYGITTGEPPHSPLYSRFRLLGAYKFSLSAMKEMIKNWKFGQETQFKKRGFPEEPEVIRSKVRDTLLDVEKAGGDIRKNGVIFLTRMEDVRVMFFAERVRP